MKSVFEVIGNAGGDNPAFEQQMTLHEKRTLAVEELMPQFPDDELGEDDRHDSINTVRPELTDVAR